MTRSEQLSDWIASSLWAKFERSAMAGDASSRRYERLTHGSDRVILMDAPPNICGDQAQFVHIANHLQSIGLAAPNVLEWDPQFGVMLLEDLGEADFASHLLQHPEEEHTLYHAAGEILSVIHAAPAPDGLVSMSPDVAVEMIDLAFEWAAQDQSNDLHGEIRAQMHQLMVRTAVVPNVLSLRDFHAENLIWRPKKPAHQKIGLLDFQDAFLAHPTYDFASMLRDARRDVSPDLLSALLPDPDDQAAFHIIAIQRNLRILGIFHRLAKRDGKQRYLSFIPRVLAHIQTDLQADHCREIAPLINRAFGVNP